MSKLSPKGKKINQVFWPLQIARLEEKIKEGHQPFMFNLRGQKGNLYISSEKCRYGIFTKAGGMD